MKYGELPKGGESRTLESGAVIVAPQPQMRCSECGDGPYSAQAGDYWHADPDSDVTCGECGGLMELGREVTRWEPSGSGR